MKRKGGTGDEGKALNGICSIAVHSGTPSVPSTPQNPKVK